MANFILSAFADEYSENFTEQLEALKKFDISHLEIRGVDGKNVSALNKEEVKTAKAKLDDYGIKLSAIGSPIGKLQMPTRHQAHALAVFAHIQKNLRILNLPKQKKILLIP